MKKLAVIMPTPWDTDQLLRLANDFDIRVFGGDLFESLVSLPALSFDVERFCDETAHAAAAWKADGVIGTLDYPGALIAAAVAEKLGLPSPRLEALLTLSHKYESRVLQRRVVPEAVPPFCLINDKALPAQYPLFVKPVKGTLSAWAREVGNASDLEHMLSAVHPEFFAAAMRPMNALLRRFPAFTVDAERFLGEAVLEGDLFTAEAFVAQGQVGHLGIVDSFFYPGTRSFQRFVYPSRLSVANAERMWDISERVIAASGFDNGVFNVEFIYDANTDRLAIIEINPRICAQFSDLYEKVDGRNSYDLLAAIATSSPLPERNGGRFAVAASCVLRTFNDLTPKRLPSPATLAELEKRHGGARIVMLCKENQPLSWQLQDAGSFRYAVANIGGATLADIDEELDALIPELGIVLA